MILIFLSKTLQSYDNIMKLQTKGRKKDKQISTCTVEIAPHALKGQKLLAQGNALGYFVRKPVAL